MSDAVAATQAAASWLNKNVTVKTGSGEVSFINNSYIAGLQKSLYNFFKSGKFCDVTVACRDESYQAHSVILASGCAYFDSELESGEEEIYLPKTVSASGFEPILEYLYTGTLTLDDEISVDVKNAARLLQIKPVQILCDAYDKMPPRSKGNISAKTVDKSPADNGDSNHANNANKKKESQMSSVPESTKNIIPESLRSSLSVSVTSSSSSANPQKSSADVKKLNSGLEIIPISGPGDAKRPKLDDEEFPDDSEEDYSDEEGLSDLDDEEAEMRFLAKNGQLNEMDDDEIEAVSKKYSKRDKREELPSDEDDEDEEEENIEEREKQNKKK